jgi:hypothetical protein
MRLGQMMSRVFAMMPRVRMLIVFSYLLGGAGVKKAHFPFFVYEPATQTRSFAQHWEQSAWFSRSSNSSSVNGDSSGVSCSVTRKKQSLSVGLRTQAIVAHFPLK